MNLSRLRQLDSLFENGINGRCPCDLILWASNMSRPEITPDQILNAIQHVPPERWAEALRAIENLQEPPTISEPTSSCLRTGTDLLDSPLIGIWSDRSDVANNHQFARELRRQAEQLR